MGQRTKGDDDNAEHNTQNTTQWTFFAWASWVIAVLMVTFGIWHLPVDAWIQAYFGMAGFFLMGSTFTLSKTIRDNHEGHVAVSEPESVAYTLPRAA